MSTYLAYIRCILQKSTLVCLTPERQKNTPQKCHLLPVNRAAMECIRLLVFTRLHVIGLHYFWTCLQLFTSSVLVIINVEHFVELV